MSRPSGVGFVITWAMSRHSADRPTQETITSRRRPPRRRSRAGPITGATTAKGAMVTSRYSSTDPRAPLLGFAKKIDPARETATHASAHIVTACVRMSRPNGVSGRKRGSLLIGELESSGGISRHRRPPSGAEHQRFLAPRTNCSPARHLLVRIVDPSGMGREARRYDATHGRLERAGPSRQP